MSNKEKYMFDEIIEDCTRLGLKIPTNCYLETGKYPIIDQGQNYIAGFYDESQGLYSDTPAIIFGDHTRVFKYVDFPFFLGADGVKILKAKKECHYKYLYYYFLQAKFPNTGYARHYKWLKELEIPFPEIEKQKEISSNLDKVTSIIYKHKVLLEKYDTLIKSRFIEMFGDIKDKVLLSFYIESLTAGKSLAGETECENKVLKTGAVTYDYFDKVDLKNLPQDYIPFEEHKVKIGDVIISRMNTAELVGACAYVWDVDENVYLPDRLWRAEITENVNPIFLWQLLIQTSTKEKIRNKASGTSGSMKNISKSNFLTIEVIKVPLELQQQFAAFVQQIDKSKF